MNRLVLIIVLVIAVARLAHADSARLAEARKAVDEVRYDDAQRLLVSALEEGGNSPAGVREIYKLSASTAVVMGQSDVGEQYYRRWLALDPTATLSSDVAPKLRAPFEAARAYIGAHGRLAVTAERVTSTVIVLAIVADPLTMVRAAKIDGAAPVTFDAQRRAELVAGEALVRVAILDPYGNTLVELEVEAGNFPAGETVPLPPPPPAPSKTWMAFGIPAGVFLVGGVVAFGIGYRLRVDADNAALDSSQHYFSEIDDKVQMSTKLGYVAAGAGAIGLALAIPAAILYTRSKESGPQVAPLAGGGATGLAVTGRF